MENFSGYLSLWKTQNYNRIGVYMANELATVNDAQLPATLEDLSKFALIGRDKLQAVRAEIAAIKKVGLASEVLEQKRAEAQEIAELVTLSEMRMGEMLKEIPKATPNNNPFHENHTGVNLVKPKSDVLEEIGLNRMTANRFEQMADHPEIVQQAIAEAREHDDIVSRAAVLKKIKAAKKSEELRRAHESIDAQRGEADAVLYIGDSTGIVQDCDLLLTDPPYSTDVEDIGQFVDTWLYPALSGVKPTGFAYVFIGAYPEELRAYLNARIPEHMKLTQVLVWEYKNTLGNNPKARYKQNWQACLFYRGENAPDLNCPLTSEQWAVQEINAPDGRQGDRYHAWQKPIEIAERFIRHSTQKGMAVYDPYACTGTFLLAAAKLGRNAIGYEINPENAEIAYMRGCVRG